MENQDSTQKPKQKETDSTPLTIEDIRNISDAATAHLKYKPYMLDQETIERELGEGNLPEDIITKLMAVCRSRDRVHMLRLLQRPGVEREFAIAYISKLDTCLSRDDRDSNEWMEINDVINSEGPDTTMFWTFAPYVFSKLKERGCDEETALKLVLRWSKGGISTQSLNQEKPYARLEKNNLKGLEQFENTQYVLNADPQHVSHKFTEQEAARIADLLLADNLATQTKPK